MSDIASLLDRTTPGDLPPLDVPELARRGRRRRARRRAMAASAATASVVVLGVAAVTVLGADPDRPDVAVPAVGPDGQPLTEPVGSWSRADDPPFSPRVDAFGGTLSDGRVVVWGGHADDGDGDPSGREGDAPTGFADGGVLDPATGAWDPIPAAPLPPPTVGGMFVTSAQLVDDRLAVVTGSTDGTLHAAVYDTAEGRWIDAPDQIDVLLTYDAMAWDGETLALVRTRPGGVGHAGDARLDWRADAPVTLRWRPGDDRWTAGAPAPFGLREHAGAAFDGGRLALWGGTGSTGSAGGTGGGAGSVANDGAVYDVAADAWTDVPEAPLPGRVHAATAWRDGRLVVGGGTDTLADAGEHLSDMAAWDPATGTWEELPAAPEGGLDDPYSTWAFVEGHAPPLVAASRSGSGEPEPRWFYGPDGWEQAPLGAVTDLGGLVVATLGHGNFGSVPFELEVRGGPDEWLDAAAGPFDNRMGAATVPTPDGHLVVVGGLEGADLELRGDAWVFDLTGGEAGG